ncbi:hypothetical protein HYS72_00935 [Candidatus Pacearchaeota archaeon]|nr:hypothetical protein [Candidatus Pacearchaeota archaeon]
MKLIKKKTDKLIFSAEVDNSLANAIRRYISQIPIVAVDEVEISKNDSALYDETLAHRIGLIPLKAKKQTGKIKLDSKKEGIVYSGELKGDAEVVYDKIPITLLDKGQELEIKATLKSGRGFEHAKFSPGLMFFRNIAELKIDKKFKDKIKKICPNANIKESGNQIIIIDDGEEEISDVCAGIAEKAGEKPEMKENSELIIKLESFGQISLEALFEKSIDELRKDFHAV